MEEVVYVAGRIRDLAWKESGYAEASRKWSEDRTEITPSMRGIVNFIIESNPELTDSFALAVQTDEMMLFDEIFNDDNEAEIDVEYTGDEIEIEIEEEEEENLDEASHLIVSTENYIADSSESKLRKIITEISNAFNISSDFVLDILIMNNFKIDSLSEKLIEEGYSKNEVSKQEILRNCSFEGVRECEVCLSYHQANDMFELSCCHSFCLDCWVTNMKTKIESHDIDIVCLHECCSCRVSVESIRKFVGEDHFDRFMRIVDHHFSVSSSNRVIECSNSRCRHILTVGIDDQYGNALQCRQCGQFTCIECKDRAHFPLACHETSDLHINLYSSLVLNIKKRF